MNIRQAILKEHSKKQTLLIAAYISGNKNRFDKLMALFLGPDYRITQRAAWIVSLCTTAHPELIKPWLRKMISNLSKPGLPDAVKRNTVRILQFIQLPRTLMGPAAQHCFSLLQSPKEPVAVKVFSMSVLLRICREEPDLKNELRLMIESQMPYASKGFVSRGNKILKELTKLQNPD
jgi:hypothetical protein